MTTTNTTKTVLMNRAEAWEQLGICIDEGDLEAAAEICREYFDLDLDYYINPILKFKVSHKLTYRQLAALLGWSWRSCQNWALGTHKIPERALKALELLEGATDLGERVRRVKAEVPNLQGKVKKKR